MIFNMKLATSEQIKEIDRLATSKYKIPSLLRMELAGLKSYEIIMKEYSPKNTLIVAGTGNNGGDGLVVSRYLFLNKYRCSIIIVGTSKIRSEDFKKNLSILKKLGIKPIDLVRKNESIWKENYKNKKISELELIHILSSNPKLIERPIIEAEKSAVIARPIENLVAFLEKK